MKRFLIIGGSILAAIILVISGWLAYNAINNRQNNTPNPSIGSFEECVAAGYPIMETYPAQCRTPEGTTFTEKIPEVQDETVVLTSEKGVEIILYNWQSKKALTSPVTITGKVPGNWSFEASFPVSLHRADGTLVAEAPAQIEGDWMTEAHVPFSVTLEFDAPATEEAADLRIRKSNPSGLPENDDLVRIPVRLIP